MPPADALHNAPQEKHAPHENQEYSKTADHISNLNEYRLTRHHADTKSDHDGADEHLPKLSLHHDGQEKHETGSAQGTEGSRQHNHSESKQWNDSMMAKPEDAYMDDGAARSNFSPRAVNEALVRGGSSQSEQPLTLAQSTTTDAPTPTPIATASDAPTPMPTAIATDAPTTGASGTAQSDLNELNVIGQELNVLNQQFNLLEQQFASLESGSSTPPTSDNPVPPSTPVPTTPPTSDNPTPVPTTPPTSDNPTPAPTTPPTTTSTTPGAYSSLGPNGEVAGSTATTFGVSAMPAVTEAANAFYVSADGSANGNGSKEDPFATLQQAQKAMEKSTIKTTYVEGGTYNQSSALNLTSADSGESFIGIGGSSNPAILNGGGTSGSIISINGADNITVEGMQLQNTQKNLFSWSSADAAITANNSSGDNFSYNTIQNVGEAYSLGAVTDSQFDGNQINNVQQAMAFNPGSSGNTIDSNSITNVSNLTGGNDVGAINLDAATNSTISNNYIENTQEAGIELENWGGVSPIGNSIVGNTVINSNTAATPSSSYDATGSNPSDMGAIYAWQGAGNASVDLKLNIANNYIKNSGAGFENVGIYLDDGVSGATVTGNHIESGGSGWSILLHGGSNLTVKDNIVNLTSSTGQQHGVLMQSDGPPMTNDAISNNTFYASGANGGAYTDYSGPSTNIPQTITDNTYSGVSPGNFDSNPINQTIQYVDPDAGNYSLVGSTGQN